MPPPPPPPPPPRGHAASPKQHLIHPFLCHHRKPKVDEKLSSSIRLRDSVSNLTSQLQSLPFETAEHRRTLLEIVVAATSMSGPDRETDPPGKILSLMEECRLLEPVLQPILGHAAQEKGAKQAEDAAGEAAAAAAAASQSESMVTLVSQEGRLHEVSLDSRLLRDSLF